MVIILASGIFSDSASENVDNFFYEIGRYIQSFSGSVDPQGQSQDVTDVVDSGIETTIAGKNFFISAHEAIVNVIILITNRLEINIDHTTILILSMIVTGILTGIAVWRLAKVTGITLIIVLILIFVIWGWGISTVFVI